MLRTVHDDEVRGKEAMPLSVSVAPASPPPVAVTGADFENAEMPLDGDEKIPSRNSDTRAGDAGQCLESEDDRQRSAYVVPESNDSDGCEEYVDGDALWFGSNDDDDDGGGDSTLGENNTGDIDDERSRSAPTLFGKELYGSWLSCCCPLGFLSKAPMWLLFCCVCKEPEALPMPEEWTTMDNARRNTRTEYYRALTCASLTINSKVL